MKNIASFILIFIFILLPLTALAQEAGTLAPTGFGAICSREAGLGSCVQRLYLFSLGLGALVALLMLILAGYRYMTASGNAQQLENAKESFRSAFVGLIIIFIGFILLNLINPDLIRFRDPTKTLTLPPLTAPLAPTAPTVEQEPDIIFNTRAQLAKQILALEDQGRLEIATVHASLIPDQANARQNILDTAAGKPAQRSSYKHEGRTGPGGSTVLDTRMLDAVVRMAQVYKLKISEFAGGVHSAGSSHYSGTAVDFTFINDVHIDANHPYYQDLMNRCAALGASEPYGPSTNNGHDTHVHCGWPAS